MPRDLLDSIPHRSATEQQFGHANHGAAQLLATCASAAFRSGIQEPLVASAQLINHLAGSSVLPQPTWVAAAQPSECGSATWFADNIGAGIGLVLPFLLVEGLTSAAVTGRIGISSACVLRSPANISLRRVAPILKSTIDGAVFGMLFNPTPDTTDAQSFWRQRAIAAASNALTFGAQTALSCGLLPGIPRAATAVPRSYSLGQRLGVASVAGAGAGVVSAETNSLLTNHTFAPLDIVRESMLSFAVTGSILGTIHGIIDCRSGETRLENPAILSAEPEQRARIMRHPGDVTASGIQYPLRTSAGAESGERSITHPISEPAEPQIQSPDSVSQLASCSTAIAGSIRTSRIIRLGAPENGPFLDYNDFSLNGCVWTSLPFRETRVSMHGAQIPVLVQEGLNHRSVWNELLPALQAIPDASLVSELTVLKEAHWQQPWADQMRLGTIHGSALPDGTINIFRPQPDRLGRVLLHEWSHLCRLQMPEASTLFDRVEAMEPLLLPRGSSESTERWALLSEQILSPQTTQSDVLISLNPLRAAILCQAFESQASRQNNQAVRDRMRSILASLETRTRERLQTAASQPPWAETASAIRNYLQLSTD